MSASVFLWTTWWLTGQGHGNALGYGDREAAIVSRWVFEQDNTRKLRSLERLFEAVVQGFWLWWSQAGQRRQRQLLGRLLWLDRLDIKHAICQLSTHDGVAITRDQVNVTRLMRYRAGNLVCNKVVGCKLDVPGIAGTPQGSVLVMTDAAWAGDVNDRRSYSGIAVRVKRSTEDTWYPVYASIEVMTPRAARREALGL